MYHIFWFLYFKGTLLGCVNARDDMTVNFHHGFGSFNTTQKTNKVATIQNEK